MIWKDIHPGQYTVFLFFGLGSCSSVSWAGMQWLQPSLQPAPSLNLSHLSNQIKGKKAKIYTKKKNITVYGDDQKLLDESSEHMWADESSVQFPAAWILSFRSLLLCQSHFMSLITVLSNNKGINYLEIQFYRLSPVRWSEMNPHHQTIGSFSSVFTLVIWAVTVFIPAE